MEDELHFCIIKLLLLQNLYQENRSPCKKGFSTARCDNQFWGLMRLTWREIPWRDQPQSWYTIRHHQRYLKLVPGGVRLEELYVSSQGTFAIHFPLCFHLQPCLCVRVTKLNYTDGKTITCLDALMDRSLTGCLLGLILCFLQHRGVRQYTTNYLGGNGMKHGSFAGSFLLVNIKWAGWGTTVPPSAVMSLSTFLCVWMKPCLTSWIIK